MSQKILIVDDNDATRTELAQMLASSGYETHEAATVPAAMRLLNDADPDLLITEVRVDTYNGLHLIAMAPRPIPAIVITGYTDAVIEADARRLGAEYLSKPVPPTTIRDVIQRTLQTAAERGVFLPARRDPRTTLTRHVAVSVDDMPARLVDTSAGGARLEVRGPAGHPLPSMVTMRLPEAEMSFQVDVAWKRRRDEQTWICGIEVAHRDRLRWKQALERLPV